MHPHPHRHQPHISPATPGGSTASFSSFDLSKKKNRGSYNCGRCGLPKKGHVCHLPPPPADGSPLAVVTPSTAASVLKMEGCSNLGGFVLCSSSLSTLWLSDLHSLYKMVFNCPNMREISLGFSRQENDTTDLVGMVDNLGRHCSRLQNIHIASVRLSHAVVLALTAANLRGLRMLSLVLGADITDASVAAISSCYSKLELLDLSGTSLPVIFMPNYKRLLQATFATVEFYCVSKVLNYGIVSFSGGIQFATAQLPHLELMDCGLTICDPNSDSPTSEGNGDFELQTTFENKLHLIYQKLIIKHARLRKLSLWGCSGLDVRTFSLKPIIYSCFDPI
ncbi:F-box/LRR-repeat protein 17 [Linum perenne]